ncbi:MAG TPA: hypothetical protein VHA14_07650 [Bryobacteraceae bacterium]|nr:hypothetical protein [Bryobacteraceae bacterium]
MPRKKSRPAKGAKRKQKRGVPKKKAFLAAFIETCSITEAAAAVGIDRCNHYDWLKADPKYAADFEAAIPIAAQNLEDDAVKWARVGIFEPNIYQGQFQYGARKRIECALADGTTVFEDELPPGAAVVATREVEVKDVFLGVHKRSESLLSKLLSAWLPEKYGKKVEVTGKDGAPLVPTVMEVVFVDPPSEEPGAPAQSGGPAEAPPAV